MNYLRKTPQLNHLEKAEVDKELFYKGKTTMLFGSAQAVISKLVGESNQSSG